MTKYIDFEMSKQEKTSVIAIMGTISGKVPMEVIRFEYKPTKILLWGFDGISKQVYDWSKNQSIEIKQCYPQPWNDETKYAALKEIVEKSDIILLFHDYHPSSWVDNYNSNKTDEPLDLESSLIYGIAQEYGKKIRLWKLEKIYHHQFMIKEQDEKGGHIFDIEIPSKDMNADSARGEAMAKAQMYFLNYIYSPLRRKNAGFYSLKRLEDRFWREVNTDLIEQWFNDITKMSSN